MKIDILVKNLLTELSELENVDIIAIGGSRARKSEDENSDYDIYIYYNEEINVIKRKEILDKYIKYMEYKNSYWEEEDDGVLNNGVEMEIIYRHSKFITDVYQSVYVKGETSFGYTTCMLENILTSYVFYDKYNKMSDIKDKIKKYPNKLKNNIIFNNLELLDDKMPSLSYQIIKALKRKDYIAINHRLTEYIAIYFDIIFAINSKYNVGEKRLLKELEKLEIKPNNCEEKFEKLFKIAMIDSDNSIKLINEISSDLYNLVNTHYEDYTKSGYSQINI